MSTTRVLITGAGGQLGHDLVAVCGAAGDDVVALDRAAVDVGDETSVRRAVSEIRPHLIINSAAWTAVDACESDPDRAMRDNADAVRWLRQEGEAVGAHLVQISTDYVFDGTLSRPYRPDDSPNPHSVYGRSKRVGEMNAGPDATIVRTSWVCGEHGANMVKTVLRLLPTTPELAFVTDQRGCPTFTADLAVLVRQLAVTRQPGIFHGTNQRAVSWYEFVREVVAAAGGDPAIVRPITTDELDPPRPAQRPANGVLDGSKLADVGISPLRDFSEPLAELIAVLRP
ncbi:MAG TPA: dTDP-4-dehydrorhamnose reductase [Ilumatobacter sp.]|nr:dTDP-4-dehydrorhamnose reductase [Ilumatobacter sp.]